VYNKPAVSVATLLFWTTAFFVRTGANLLINGLAVTFPRSIMDKGVGSIYNLNCYFNFILYMRFCGLLRFIRICCSVRTPRFSSIKQDRYTQIALFHVMAAVISGGSSGTENFFLYVKGQAIVTAVKNPSPLIGKAGALGGETPPRLRSLGVILQKFTWWFHNFVRLFSTTVKIYNSCESR